MRRNRRRPIAVVLATLIAGVSCTSTGAGPQMSPGPVEGELVSTDDSLPMGFPDHPLPGDPTILYSAVSQLGVVVYLATDVPDEEVVRRLVAELPARGWTIYACSSTAGEERITFLVAGKDRMVASTVVGYSAEHAARIDGARYSYLVSIAENAPEPIEQERTC